MNLTTIKKHSLVATFVALGLAGCGGDSVETNTNYEQIDTTAPVSDWELVWSDDFEGSSIDDSKWTFEVNCQGGGNNEQQCYTDSEDNAFVSDGTLKIVALPAGEDAEGNLPYTSARLNSKNKGDFTYGRIEVRAKMPEGQGSWPAVWMMPTDSVYGSWPKSGEIDIVEAVNLKTIDAEGNVESRVHGTLHYGGEWPDNKSSGKAYEFAEGASPADGFHTYAIEWQEGEIRWYVDGYLYQTQMDSEVRYNSNGDMVGLNHRGWFTEYYDQSTGELVVDYGPAPFDQKFHLIMNLAVGGDWPENVNNLGIDESAFVDGQTLEIDYVRVYQCNQNPDTGKGCETVRAGYKNEDTLVIGEAPIPSPPSSGVPENLTIFNGTPNPDWPAWDCCGGSTPELVDDAEKGSSYKFVVGATPTVNGFVTREAFITDENGSPSPYDASGMIETGSVSFDMKVTSAPNDTSAAWLFKVESNEASTAAEVPITTSVEGVAPTTGEWQTYTFPLQDLVAAGLDPSAIDAIMIFPAWGAGEGAEYLVNNVEISTPSPELVLFGDGENPNWPMWDCCGGTVPTEVMDGDRGAVAEFEIGATPTVVGFKPPADSGIQFDASELMVEGVIQFDMKVVQNPNSPDAVWKFKVESDGASTAAEVDLTTGSGGQEPVVGEWQTYTFSLQTLADAGLDLSAIDVVMIFPLWGEGEGAVFRVDDARIYNPGSSSDGVSILKDDINTSWSLWDCCSGSTPEIVETGAQGGKVAQFEIQTDPETVAGFQAKNGVSFDALSLLANGAISFDMRVMSPPEGSNAQWLVKVESSNAATSVEFPLSSGNYGQAPVTGEWQRYHFTLQSLFDAGLNIRDIKAIKVFPTKGESMGAVYQIGDVSIDNF